MLTHLEMSHAEPSPVNDVSRGIRPPWSTLAWLASVATAVIAPMLYYGNASGHDFQFHIASWMEVARQWHHGVLYPRWAEFANFGHGEPRFIFYPPLSWMAGAALGNILPWRIVPGAFIWLTLILAGSAMYRLAGQWLSRGGATLAAVMFALNPYHLLIVYFRSDFAELLASALFPLLIGSALAAARQGWRRVPSLAVVYALIWLSNAPAAVIATYSIAVLAIAQVLTNRTFKPAILAAVSGALGLGLAAFYILPAAFEQRWVHISQALAPGLLPWQNFLFTRSNDPDFLYFNWKVSFVAMMVTGFLALSMAIAARHRPRLPELFWPLVALGAISVALMFPTTLLLWKFLPELKFVQFPWRWLLPLDVVAVLLFALGANGLRRMWIATLAAALALVTLGAWMTRTAWWDSQDVPSLASALASGEGYEGTDEYASILGDHTDLPPAAPRVGLYDRDTDDVKPMPGDPVNIERWTAAHKRFTVTLQRPATVAVKLMDYPAWRANVNCAPAPIEPAEGTAQALLTLPSGVSRIELRFSLTPDRLAGDAISLLSLLGLAALYLGQARLRT